MWKTGHLHGGVPFCRSAVILVLILVAVLVLILILILILIAALVGILILVLILVIHGGFLQNYIYGLAAILACPVFQALSFGLKRMLARSPAAMAAVIPPAADFIPPVNIPRNPSCWTASLTPFARL